MYESVNRNKEMIWCSFTALFYSQAYVLRFVQQIQSKTPLQLHLTSDEMKKAQLKVLKDRQAQKIQEEIQLLRQNNELPRKHKCIGLNPFVDEVEGLLKV